MSTPEELESEADYERAIEMSEQLPECPKSGCPACVEQGQREGERIGTQKALIVWASDKDAYEQGQRDALAGAVQRFRDAFDSLNYEHLFDPENCECVWCEDGSILIAAIKGEESDPLMYRIDYDNASIRASVPIVDFNTTGTEVEGDSDE